MEVVISKCILANHDGDTNDDDTKSRFDKHNMVLERHVLQRVFGIFVHFFPVVCKILPGERKPQSLIFRILILELNAVIENLA